MRDKIIELVKKYNITKVVMEEVRPEQYSIDEEALYSHLRNPATAKLLYWLQGVISIALYEYDKKIETEFILPNSWRSKIGIKVGRGIKRDELKAADIRYVKDNYGFIVNDDEADAIGILTSCYITEKPKPVKQKKPEKDLSAFAGFDFK